jgi:hypothetical protein
VRGFLLFLLVASAITCAGVAIVRDARDRTIRSAACHAKWKGALVLWGGKHKCRVVGVYLGNVDDPQYIRLTLACLDTPTRLEVPAQECELVAENQP